MKLLQRTFETTGHLKHTLATYVYSHCNICNARSTFATSRLNICNIHRLKHIKHTVATCAHLLAAPQWTLVDAELDASMELDATALRSDLGCAERKYGREACGVAKAQREA